MRDDIWKAAYNAFTEGDDLGLGVGDKMRLRRAVEAALAVANPPTAAQPPRFVPVAAETLTGEQLREAGALTAALQRSYDKARAAQPGERAAQIAAVLATFWNQGWRGLTEAQAAEVVDALRATGQAPAGAPEGGDNVRQ